MWTTFQNLLKTNVVKYESFSITIGTVREDTKLVQQMKEKAEQEYRATHPEVSSQRNVLNVLSENHWEI
jgi:hypothetical protein